MTTMNKKYDDGSDHECCSKCGLCIDCGDCALYGCGKNKLTLNEYQEIARTTATYRIDDVIIYPALGLASEAGEVAGKVKKVLRDSNGDFTMHKKAIAKELGDVLWYVATLAEDIGYTLEEVAQMNVDKLQSMKDRNKIHGSGDER